MKKLALALCFISIGCASNYQNPSLNLIPEATYKALVRDNTQRKQVYEGFMNVLDVQATLLSTDLSRAQVDHGARIYQWTPETYASEKGKVESDLAKQTAFHLSFFVPERKHDDLQKPASKWKLFLDVGGKRYEAKVTRKKESLLAELQNYYPHHTRWQTSYIAVFAVPTVITETAPSKLTLTGPVAATSLDFINKSK